MSRTPVSGQERSWRACRGRTSSKNSPEIAENCVGKSCWFQQHLGGVLLVGFRKGKKKSERHAALLFPIEGKLYVSDGEIMPVEQYPFYVEGFEVWALPVDPAPATASKPASSAAGIRSEYSPARRHDAARGTACLGGLLRC
ncbi:MAG: hypothetical protein J0H41_17205 [Rhizobiales bacterium]|nr:hypothetical protein [Hyphomicrobiales bacterium]